MPAASWSSRENIGLSLLNDNSLASRALLIRAAGTFPIVNDVHLVVKQEPKEPFRCFVATKEKTSKIKGQPPIEIVRSKDSSAAPVRRTWLIFSTTRTRMVGTAFVRRTYGVSKPRNRKIQIDPLGPISLTLPQPKRICGRCTKRFGCRKSNRRLSSGFSKRPGYYNTTVAEGVISEFITVQPTMRLRKTARSMK